MQARWWLIFMLISFNTNATTLEDAKLKLSQKDFAAAHSIYLTLAKQNDAKACYNLGVMYQNGDGLMQSVDEAVKWYTKSATLNYNEAQYMLASMVFRREINTISYKDAARYYQQAAEQGHVKSQLNLGILYYRGDIIPQDLEESYKWFYQAASNNNSEAQGYIGNTYMNGIGVQKNIVKAAMWLLLATQNENQSFRNRHTKTLNYTLSKMTNEQINSANHLANRCKSKKFKEC